MRFFRHPEKNYGECTQETKLNHINQLYIFMLKKSVNCAIEVVLNVTDSTSNNLIDDCEVKLSSVVQFLTLKVKGDSTFIFLSTVCITNLNALFSPQPINPLCVDLKFTSCSPLALPCPMSGIMVLYSSTVL